MVASMPIIEKPRKRILLTVNPQLIEGKRMQTIRSLATALDKEHELIVCPIDEYDYKKHTVMTYQRVAGGKFERMGREKPYGDLWIVYTDGYYLDAKSFGFKIRRDFIEAQFEFHQKALDKHSVERVINPPDVERRTLKSWFADLDAKKYNLIPTYMVESVLDAHDLLKQENALVAKLSWGGAGDGAVHISNEKELKKFEAYLSKVRHVDLSDFVFQPYCPGDEKRLWFLGGKFVNGRRAKERKTPWAERGENFSSAPYNRTSQRDFALDLKAAEKLCRLSKLEIGSIDFLGDKINEINGAGTLFTEYFDWKLIVDARPQLVDYVLSVASTL